MKFVKAIYDCVAKEYKDFIAVSNISDNVRESYRFDIEDTETGVVIQCDLLEVTKLEVLGVSLEKSDYFSKICGEGLYAYVYDPSRERVSDYLEFLTIAYATNNEVIFPEGVDSSVAFDLHSIHANGRYCENVFGVDDCHIVDFLCKVWGIFEDTIYKIKDDTLYVFTFGRDFNPYNNTSKYYPMFYYVYAIKDTNAFKSALARYNCFKYSNVD